MAMKKQMELFEEGGLMDEGGTVDPVSGNDVPPGSTQEEVRDDIPAQLSEGEFVFPADVVRYIGLENLMRMRQEAKQGLAQMEAMGQMGNGDEAVMPDDLPFDMYDLEVEDEQGELNFNVGGTVPTPGFTGIGAYTPPPPVTTGFTPYVAPTVPTTGIQQQTTPQVSYTTATGTTNLPTFGQTVGTAPGQYDEFKTYVNDAGQTLQIPFKNGQPIYPIPEGYKLQTADTAQPDSGQTTVGTTQVTQQDDDGGMQDYGGGTTLGGVKIAGYSPEEIEAGVTKAKDRFAITGDRGIDLLNMIPGASYVKDFLGADISAPLFGSEPTIPEDASVPPGIGMPVAAMQARYNAEQALGTPITGYVGFEKGDLDPNSGGIFDKNGIAVDMDENSPTFGDQTKNEQGTFNYASSDEAKKALSAGFSSGWHGGKLGEKSYGKLSDKAKSNYDKFAKAMGYEDHKKEDEGTETPSESLGTVAYSDSFDNSDLSGIQASDVLSAGEEYEDDFDIEPTGSYVTDVSTGTDSESEDKIVCTAMNNAYGFGSFRQTVWLQHSKNMDPAYQKGYHRIFKPLIKFAYSDQTWYNMAVRSTLEGIARRRTADIWMQKHGKRHWRGAVERAVLEPLCYIVGKIK
jgi:hypothetical protein